MGGGAMTSRNPPSFSSWDHGRAFSPRQSAQFLCDTARRVEQLSVSEWSQRRAVSIVGNHPTLLDALAKAEKIAAFDEPVLITGESGSGKEALAEAIYLLGPRRGRPFVAVNCPQFQEGNLTVSELFGHKRGSFTGAIADRKGCFAVADGGVIFLDEVGDLHMSAQVMLLRALATGEFQALGDSRTHSVNVRVVAASNRPLQKTGIGDHFRNDLFFRLRYFHLNVPPLRERGDDWSLLVEYFLARLQLQYGVTKRLSADSLKVLAGYDWPGNVRELGSVVTMGYALSDGETIEPNNFMTLLERGEGVVGATDEDLYRQVVVNGESFWEAVHQPFMNRDLNRSQVKELIRRGLIRARGSYRRLLESFGLPADDYQKFMDFLRHHRLKP
jgi:transcriptional regulator with GAF, ATPase, and Fis domain